MVLLKELAASFLMGFFAAILATAVSFYLFISRHDPRLLIVCGTSIAAISFTYFIYIKQKQESQKPSQKIKFKYCFDCGSENHPEAKNCFKCGAKLA